MICATSFADLARWAGQVCSSPRRHRAFAGRKSNRLPLNHKWFLLALLVIVLVLLLVIDLGALDSISITITSTSSEHEPEVHNYIGRGQRGS